MIKDDGDDGDADYFLYHITLLVKPYFWRNVNKRYHMNIK